ncbi:glycoside hydrolase family 88/105 protein [Flavobacterium yafengii]|uniref:glycoside hydrolase family 88/105 protein n=1 Tax=Flavobacterium yafengii TaxID=3041253 RepID=UPI0024A83F33|nr:glycoside hydrolase family 88 protein [Flavobacterium yafengii]MDI6046229.1 glycoside hydrolase family 88 protein [Flavobacterium yafengii]
MKNNILKPLIAVLLIVFVSLQMNAQKDKTISKKLKWSERMALSIMMQHKESYMIDDATTPKWDYVHGLVLTSFDELNKKHPNQKYSAYSKTYVDKLVQEDGTIDTYKLDTYNIDMVVAGRLLFDLYTTTKEAKYLKALQTLRKQIEEQPRTASGGFWHKKIYPNQMWLDGLYMGEPFYAQYTVTFEDGKNLYDVAKQFELIQKNARDSKTGLFYHGWDESKQMPWANKTTGTSPNFWSRSLGWYAMALVDVLDYFPKDHPKQKELVSYLNQLANTLVKFQDKSGLWYQVTDKGAVGGNYLEASGTAMFTYAFAKGVNKGYLPKKFKTAAKKAFSGMTKHLIKVGQNGEVTITQACAVAGLGGNPYRDGSFEYYVNERKKDNDPKATGPFILAALELNK